MTAPYTQPPDALPEADEVQTARSERVERCALILIVLVVGALAGRASFSHVVDWSMHNLPAGTPRSYGYTNAMVSELLPVGALLFIRFQRRHGRKPGRLAWSMLIGAGLFSMTAQLAVAVPSPSGWLVASVPTLAFMALTKLLLSMKPAASAATLPALPAHPVRTRLAPEPAKRPILVAVEHPTSQPAVEAQGRLPVRKRVTAKSLTNAAKVVAAVTELGPGAPVSAVAEKAGVSPSTVRRHLRPMHASPSLKRPAETPPSSDARPLAAFGAT